MDNGEQKPGVEKRIMFFSSKVELIHFVSMFFWSPCFSSFFFMTVFILNKSSFFGLAEVFPYSAKSLFPSKALQNAAARDFHRMAADASHAKEQRAEKTWGEVASYYRISTWLDISAQLKETSGQIIARSPENGIFLVREFPANAVWE